MANMNEVKGGLVRAAALAAALKIAERSARRWGTMARQAGAEEDALAAAYEGIVKAWECWDGNGDWAQHARNWSDEMAKREVNKLRSVVQTNYTRRAIRCDKSMIVENEDGGWSYADVEDSTIGADRALEASELLAEVRTKLETAARLLKGEAAATMSEAIIDRIMAGDDGESVADIASRFGYTRMSAYRVESALREALA